MSDVQQVHPQYLVLHIALGPARFQQSGEANRLVVTDDAPVFALGDNLWIERLNEEFSKEVQRACEPAHSNITVSRWDRHLYSFVRSIVEPENTQNSGMQDLLAVVAMSRLIHPTSVGGRYFAKVRYLEEGKHEVEAIQLRGISPDVIIGKRTHDWLSVTDGEKLRELIPWLSNTWHERVHRAYWNHEYAMRTYYLDARWTLIVSGLESLINTNERKCQLQFVERCSQLAAQGSIDLTTDELKLGYHLRSKLVHAENFLFGLESALPKSEQIALYEKLEELLRETVFRSLTDAAFGESFRDATSVKAAFPVSAGL
jgi:hypothetical protein